MKITPLDWLVVAAYFLVNLLIGLYYRKKASTSTSDFFVSGREVTWWLAGTSMVATTFAAVNHPGKAFSAWRGIEFHNCIALRRKARALGNRHSLVAVDEVAGQSRPICLAYHFTLKAGGSAVYGVLLGGRP